MPDNGMLGVSLRECTGPIQDLLAKLAGEQGAEWLAALKRFLRKENPWEELSSTETLVQSGNGNPLSGCLPLAGLSGLSLAKANTTLVFDWTGRLPEEARYEAIKAYFGQHLGIGCFDLVQQDGSRGIPGWQDMLVVSPVDLSIKLGHDISGAKPEHARAYCDMTRPATIEIPLLQKSGWILGDCLGGDGARLAASAYRQWVGLPQGQQPGGPLQVRRMPVNPAAWFLYEGIQYSVAPRDVHKLAANQFPGVVRRVACCDLVVFASLAVGEPQILRQIAAGTGPRIDIPGTELRYGRDWPHCPRVGRGDGGAWLGDGYADDAGEHFGSLLCARE